eukprot:COSAG01_NODE_15115_length_1372_cov_10.241948_1_plen_190_part_00
MLSAPAPLTNRPAMVHAQWNIAEVDDVPAFVQRIQRALGEGHWVGSACPHQHAMDDRFVISGLTRRPDLNGVEVQVTRQLTSREGRFVCVLAGGDKTVNVKPENLYPAFPPLLIHSLPVRSANVWALGVPREIAPIVERVPGWRDPRLGPPDADRPYFELMGDVLRLRRIKDIGATQALIALVAELGAR